MTTENKKSYTKRLIEHLEKSSADGHWVRGKDFDIMITQIKAFALLESKRIEAQNEAARGRMTFGKYKGKLLTEVAKLDESYIAWLKKSTQHLNADLKAILETL